MCGIFSEGQYTSLFYRRLTILNANTVYLFLLQRSG